jgi:hypothetical protein
LSDLLRNAQNNGNVKTMSANDFINSLQQGYQEPEPAMSNAFQGYEQEELLPQQFQNYQQPESVMGDTLHPLSLADYGLGEYGLPAAGYNN